MNIAFRGYGRQMSGTPMVILWINSGGSVTVSQRTAPAEIMPTLDSNPPRNATQLPDLTRVSIALDFQVSNFI